MDTTQPAVFAGAIEFSPVDIALILMVLAAGFVALTAPGWLLLAVAAGRRVPAGAPPGRRWAARAAGAVGGLALSGVVLSVTGAALSAVADEVILPVGTVASWAACFAVARAVRGRTARRDAGSASEGWGR